MGLRAMALSVILLTGAVAKADLSQEFAERRNRYAKKMSEKLGHTEAINKLAEDAMAKLGSPVIENQNSRSLNDSAESLNVLLKLATNEICTGSITRYSIKLDRTYNVSIVCYDNDGEETKSLHYSDRK